MTPDEKAEAARRMINIQSTLRDMREHIELMGVMARGVGSLGLAFASFHLSDSIAVYAGEVAKFLTEEFDDEGESECG